MGAIQKGTLVGFLILAQSATADVNRCRQISQESINNCNQAKASAESRSIASANSSMAAATDETEEGGRGLAGMQNSAAAADSQIWTALKTFCVEERRNCADACNGVSGTPQEVREVERLRHDCFGKVNGVIQRAEAGANITRNVASGSALSGNSAGAQGSEDLKGNIHQVAGETNLDAIRRLQRTHDCSQSGAGSETRCVGSGGDVIYIPSGPGDAGRLRP